MIIQSIMFNIRWRKEVPQNKVVEGLTYVAGVALACLSTNPQSRPTMRQVSSHLVDNYHPLTKSFSTINLGDLFGLSFEKWRD